MSERSAVQEPMLKYADEIGWTRVSRSQVRRLGRADAKPNKIGCRLGRADVKPNKIGCRLGRANVKPIGVNLRKGLACSRAIHCASYIERKEAL